MPSETRTIVFDNADIKDAIAVHHPGARESGDSDEMGRLSISNESGISIQVLAKDGDGIALSLSEDEGARFACAIVSSKSSRSSLRSSASPTPLVKFSRNASMPRRLSEWGPAVSDRR